MARRNGGTATVMINASSTGACPCSVRQESWSDAVGCNMSYSTGVQFWYNTGVQELYCTGVFHSVPGGSNI